ncbi:MAG TPA: hypothetical protein VGF24_20330 [Vicinamibacterales bacterium]|jgi:hypothetical protein
MTTMETAAEDMPARQAGVRRGIENLTRETRVLFSPWSRYVRGVGLGQHPMNFDPRLASGIEEIVAILEKRAPSNPFSAFAGKLTSLILATNTYYDPLPADRATMTLVEIVEGLSAIEDRFLHATACTILVEACVAQGWDVGVLTRPRFDVVRILLDEIRQIRFHEVTDTHGEKGPYERLQMYVNLFVALGKLGRVDALTQAGSHHVREALDLMSEVPSHYYRGRGGAMVIAMASVLGFDDVVCSDRRDYLKELLAYYDEKFGVAIPWDDTYPLMITLNTIAILRKPEYLTYRRDWLAEAARLFRSLPAKQLFPMGQYYFVALHNLGLLSDVFPDLEGAIRELAMQYAGYTKADPLDYSMYDSYTIETAWLFADLSVIPALIMRRAASIFKTFDSEEPYRNAAYGGSYVLSACAETGLAGRLFEPSDDYDGEAPFLWTVRRFGRPVLDGRSLPYLNHALINLALRMRGEPERDGPLFRSVRFLGESALRSEGRTPVCKTN